jgi:signal transduction histidine kinase
MRTMAEPGMDAAGAAPPHVMVLDNDPERGAAIAGHLGTHGHRVGRFEVSPEAPEALRRERPDLLVLADDPDGEGRDRLYATAQELGIPVLAVVEAGADPRAIADRLEAVDDWISGTALDRELLPRAARLLRRRGPAPAARRVPPMGIQTFPVIVHDLRTPLNVIGLSLRMIEQGMPRNDPDLVEDLRFVEENFKQIERMLAQLSDYFRLYEVAATGPPAGFSPGRLLSELVETNVERPGARPVAVRLILDPSCPPEAELDQARARMALLYALSNASAAADGAGTVRVSARGGPDRWITEIAIDDPPPSSVKPVALRPDLFERLCGTAAERRGMDLAIAARVTELFGGAARLDVDEGRGTTIVLDWPARLPRQ